MKILIAEDEKDLRDVMKKRLEKENYLVEVCADGEEAWHMLEMTVYDALILDIMMPKLDGLTLLKRLRSRGIQVPAMLVTAKDTVMERVEGLDQGADDYLTKPFAFEELLARLRVMLRRKKEKQIQILKAADLSVNIDTCQVLRDGKEILLTKKEYLILIYLLRNKNMVLSREQIENQVWNLDYEGGSNIVDVYIRYLRRKVDAGFEKKLIHTVRGLGYVLREDL